MSKRDKLTKQKARKVIRLVREFSFMRTAGGRPFRVPDDFIHRALKDTPEAGTYRADELADQVLAEFLGYPPRHPGDVAILRCGARVVRFYQDPEEDPRWELLRFEEAANADDLAPAAALELLTCGLPTLSCYPCSPALAARAVWPEPKGGPR